MVSTKRKSDMKHMMTSMLLLTAGLLSTTAGHAAEAWRATGFKTPESVLYDEANDRLIVSNINGGATDIDGNGFLSLVSPDGDVLSRTWASGMDAPKGMAIAGDRLYVADVNRIHVVDLATGQIANTITVDDAIFLNDVTASETGDVFVTDMMTDAIYRIVDGTAELWLKDERLNAPNGILADGDRLIVGSFGKGMKPDMTTEEPGGLIAVDLSTKTITPLPQAEAFGSLDGVVEVGNDIIVSDFSAGLLYRYTPGNAVEEFATLKPGSADIGTNGSMIFVPMMHEGEVVALTLTSN